MIHDPCIFRICVYIYKLMVPTNTKRYTNITTVYKQNKLRVSSKHGAIFTDKSTKVC
jgi:hypothetical protein